MLAKNRNMLVYSESRSWLLTNHNSELMTMKTLIATYKHMKQLRTCSMTELIEEMLTNKEEKVTLISTTTPNLKMMQT